MMKKFLLLILTCSSLVVHSQKTDNVWLLGYHYYPSFVPALDFYYNSPDTIAWNSPIEFFGANASVCNSSGDLQFYTDGISMFNYLNDTIANSTRFNYDSIMGPPYYLSTLPAQSVIITPYPGQNDQYCVFHLSIHFFNNMQNAQPLKFSYSVVDMNANGGTGEMTVKDQTIISDTMLYYSLQAVKHGNGRDWWAVVHKWNSDLLYKVLLTPNGVSYTTQQVGPVMKSDLAYGGQTLFSPDGSRYAILRSDTNEVYLFDFDRCTGMFTYQETLTYNNNDVVTGCSFSPDSRRFYVSSSTRLYQYDMSLTPVSPTRVKVGDWDGAGGFNPYYFETHRLAPDGKIYITTPPSEYLHVINAPNQPDTTCNFTQHTLKLKSYHAGTVPEFPNYRLGNLQGLPCDTLNYSGTQELQENSFSIYPNPVSSICTIKFDKINEFGGVVQIRDLTNRIVLQKRTEKQTSSLTIDLGFLSSGLYVLEFNNGHTSAGKKIAVID